MPGFFLVAFFFIPSEKYVGTTASHRDTCGGAGNRRRLHEHITFQ